LGTVQFCRRPFFAISRVVFMIAGLSACGSSGLHVRAYAYNDANDGNSVVVRIYELKDPKNFEEALLASFWTNDEAAIGSDLVRKHEITLLPDEPRELRIDVADGVGYIGAAANFRSNTGNTWRKVLPVSSGKDIRITVRAGELQLEPG
jgi:type VI secretion system protein VasD